MKKLALINSYCNTWDKLNILYNTLIKLKELNVDSLVYSPIALPSNITDIADFTFITKENPIIHWPERGMIHWKKNHQYETTLILPDYGWASIYQYKKLMEIGSNFNYDYYFPLIYDLNIDKEVENILINPQEKLFFPSSKAQSSKTGGIFMSLSKKYLNVLYPIITKNHYLEICKSNIAEKYIDFMCDYIKGDIHSHITTDIRHEHQNVSFNILPESYPFKLSIDSPQYKFLFYDMVNPIEDITFEINGLFYDFQISHKNYFLEFKDLTHIKSLNFYYNGLPLDLTQHFNNSIDIIRLIEKH